MNIFNIEIKNEVHEFIGDLGEYIYRFSFVYNKSKNIMEEIYKEIFSLKVFPYRFPEFKNGFRVLTINKKYRVFYKISSNKVIISRIFGSHEDYFNKF